jgi:CubicO group peptidase (beta-lactamase class C family)
MKINQKAILFGLLIILFFCGCKNNYSLIENNKNNWQNCTPEEVNVSSFTIDSIHQEILNGDYGLIDNFLIIRNNKIIADHKYFHNYDSIMLKYSTKDFQYNYDNTKYHPFYRQSDLHSLQSVTKSITSILIGIAIDEGYIKDINTPIITYLTKNKLDHKIITKDSITVANLLNMQSGIKWNEESLDESINNCLLMEKNKDWIQYILNQPMDTIPGVKFNYNSGNSVLLGKILKEVTGKSIDIWAEEKLFKPLGITNYYWKKTKLNEIDTEGGLYLNVYDLAKIGKLMMNEGVWENSQVVSKNWVNNSITPLVKVSEKTSYNKQWWIPKHSNGKTEIFAANGYGDQFLMIAPQHELIVIFTGWNIHDQSKKNAWKILEKRIIPSLKKQK